MGNSENVRQESQRLFEFNHIYIGQLLARFIYLSILFSHGGVWMHLAMQIL